MTHREDEFLKRCPGFVHFLLSWGNILRQHERDTHPIQGISLFLMWKKSKSTIKKMCHSYNIKWGLWSSTISFLPFLPLLAALTCFFFLLPYHPLPLVYCLPSDHSLCLSCFASKLWIILVIVQKWKWGGGNVMVVLDDTGGGGWWEWRSVV